MVRPAALALFLLSACSDAASDANPGGTAADAGYDAALEAIRESGLTHRMEALERDNERLEAEVSGAHRLIDAQERQIDALNDSVTLIESHLRAAGI